MRSNVDFSVTMQTVESGMALMLVLICICGSSTKNQTNEANIGFTVTKISSNKSRPIDFNNAINILNHFLPQIACTSCLLLNSSR